MGVGWGVDVRLGVEVLCGVLVAVFVDVGEGARAWKSLIICRSWDGPVSEFHSLVRRKKSS